MIHLSFNFKGMAFPSPISLAPNDINENLNSKTIMRLKIALIKNVFH